MFPQVFGKYILEEELARGGMARVFLATLRGAGGFEKKLVVKQIRDELAGDRDFVQRFVDEAKMTVALSHTNIVPVYELGVEQGTYFLAMERVVGLSVAELLRHGVLSPLEGAYVGVEVCRALDYAHRRMGLIHRDVTPRNVMIDEEGQVRVIDFGIAAKVSATTFEAHDGAHRDVFGSPGHMPPEQIAGERLGPFTDVFGIAVLLLEAWSGAPPFRRSTAAASLEALKIPPPPPSHADPRLLPLDDLIARATALSPAARPQEAEELARGLRRFLSGEDTGDIARALGARIRTGRAAARERRKAKPEDQNRSRPPSHEEVGTRTFAVRDEVVAWTQSSPAPSLGSGPGDGLMATPVSPERSRPPSGPVTRALPPSTPPSPAIEARVSAKPPAATPKAPPRWLFVGLLLAAGVGLLVMRLGSPASQATEVRAPAPAPEGPSAPPKEVPPGVAPLPVAPAVAVSEPKPSSAAAPAPSAPARVSFYGDPGTRVMIDGAPRGSCPLGGVSLDPGPHEFRLLFEPTGEAQQQRVELHAGERLTVRTEFTGTTPRLRLERSPSR